MSALQLNEIIKGNKRTIAQLKEEVKDWHQKYIQSVDSVKYSDPELTVQRYELYKATVADDDKTFRE